MNWNVLGFSRELKNEDQQVTSQQFFNISMNQSYKLSEKYSMELSGFYNSESLDGVTRNGALYSLNFGLQKKLRNDAQLSLSFNNILTFKNRLFTPEDLNLNYITDTTYEIESQIIKVSYKY